MIIVLENKWNVREDCVRYFAVTSQRLVTAVRTLWRETARDVSLAMLRVGILICLFKHYNVSWNQMHEFIWIRRYSIRGTSFKHLIVRLDN